MSDSAKEIQQEDVAKTMAHFGLQPPGPHAAFAQLQKAAEGHGALEGRTKELLALGMCIVSCREDAIHDHIAEALGAGASREEVLEVVGSAVLMGGRQSVAYGLRAEDELLEAM